MRTLSKLVMPKLRVAALTGKARPSVAIAAIMKVRIRTPSYFMVKAGLRAVDVARPGLGHGALGAAAQVDVAGSDDVDRGGAGGMAVDAARPRDRHLGLLGGHAGGVDSARSGDVIFGD